MGRAPREVLVSDRDAGAGALEASRAVPDRDLVQGDVDDGVGPGDGAEGVQGGPVRGGQDRQDLERVIPVPDRVHRRGLVTPSALAPGRARRAVPAPACRR